MSLFRCNKIYTSTRDPQIGVSGWCATSTDTSGYWDTWDYCKYCTALHCNVM